MYLASQRKEFILKTLAEHGAARTIALAKQMKVTDEMCAGVVGCRQAVEIPCPVQGERGDPLPVERGERQAGIETAPAQHAPELCFVQLDFVIGECLAECLGQRAKARFFQ